MYVYMYVYNACMYVCMYACMYVCMYVCMYACMHACMYACMYVCMYVYDITNMYRNSVLAEALGVCAQEDGDWAGEDAFCDTIAEVCACDQ